MLRLKKAWLFPVILAMAAPLSGLAAADNPANPAPVRTEVRPAVGGQTLTDESLKMLLDNLGYEPEVIKSTGGNPMYRLKLTRDGWEFMFYVSLSSDRTVLWMSAPLMTLPEASKIPAERLEKLLAKNFDIGPAHFCIHGNRQLFLEKPIANRGLNASTLRIELDSFTSTIKETGPLWDLKTWTVAAPVDTARVPAKTEEKLPAKPANKLPADLKELLKSSTDRK